MTLTCWSVIDSTADVCQSSKEKNGSRGMYSAISPTKPFFPRRASASYQNKCFGYDKNTSYGKHDALSLRRLPASPTFALFKSFFHFYLHVKFCKSPRSEKEWPLYDFPSILLSRAECLKGKTNLIYVFFFLVDQQTTAKLERSRNTFQLDVPIQHARNYKVGWRKQWMFSTFWNSWWHNFYPYTKCQLD